MLGMLTRTLFASGYGGQIYSLSFNPTIPSLSISSTVAAGSAPTWLTLHPTQPILYTGDEFSSPHGTLTTFEIQNGDALRQVGSHANSKEGPVHFALSPDTKQLFSACYSAGALSTTKLLEDGKFADPTEKEGRGQNYVYGGKGQNPDRQEGPHAHGVAIDPTGQYLFCTDLGTDQVHVYHIKPTRIDFVTSLAATRGSGPRHLVFSQTASRTLFYLVEELSNTVSIYEITYPDPKIDDDSEVKPNPEQDTPMPLAPTEPTPGPATLDAPPEPGSELPGPGYYRPKPETVAPVPKSILLTINPVQLNISTLPANASEIAAGDWTAAELELSHDRRFLYVSNRAPVEPNLPESDYLTIFSLDGDGKIVEAETSHFALGGVGPRDFMSSPKSGDEEQGKYVAVAFQRTNEVVVYSVDGKNITEVTRVKGIEGATAVVWRS
ncbi:lactonase family protein [Sporobolomyces koalae]|uniref:lactonase family protein n=1 Tax=Sporobolomyces koalae TaxID=500713 RepID=UPI00317E5CB4